MLPIWSCRCAVFPLFLCLCRWCAENKTETDTVKAEAEPEAVSCCGARFDGWFTVAVGVGAETETEAVKAEAKPEAVSCCGARFDGWFTVAVGVGAETETATVAKTVCPCGARLDRWRVRCVFLFFYRVWLPFVSCSVCVSNPAGSPRGVRTRLS